jgi:hypothetical protein
MQWHPSTGAMKSPLVSALERGMEKAFQSKYWGLKQVFGSL